MSYFYSIGYGLPRAVKTLLFVNVGIFLVTYMFGLDSLFNRVFGLIPYYVNTKYTVWQFFTYMFLHGGWSHIIFNMFALWMFGAELEYNWGSCDFMWFYITCGLGGGLLVWFTAFFGLSGMYSTTIGASGAIFGLLVAYGMMWPDRMIFVFGILPMKALHFVLIFGALDLMQGLSGSGSGIAYFAHVGGGVTGFIYLKYGWRIMAHGENILRKIKRSKFKVIEGTRGSANNSGYRDNDDNDEDIDRILDKIAREGMSSLTRQEKETLDKASRKNKQ